ncbi:MAG: radical SAM protein [Candidatus Riflebacteria bacterium]|nr:radical SAM protein [Candidatus Riflebacteria bacterium]
MINISKLYAGMKTTGDPLRYGKDGPPDVLHAHHFQGHSNAKSAFERRPVVVWNVTRRCHLKCVHCYTESENKSYDGELTFDEGIKLISDLREFNIPALLLSGGEPLMRPDLFELVQHARKVGVRPVLSTNGILIDQKTSQKIKETGFIYVGISLDGIGKTNDEFRGFSGAFEGALKGFRNCVEAGQRVGLRLTLTKRNVGDLGKIFDFILEERIPRACFYHLVPTGRGKTINSEDLSPEESRRAIDLICDRTLAAIRKGVDLDILTVDNHVDGPYIYLKLLQEGSPRAEEVRKLLEWNGGGAASSGVGIGCVGPTGDVFPDQFWREVILGNIRTKPFSNIWLDTSNQLMAGLKDRIPLLIGKCKSCRFLKMCGGSLRVRAMRCFNDPWMHDPACYLSDSEISTSEIPL